jgi:hypothetical protein
MGPAASKRQPWAGWESSAAPLLKHVLIQVAIDRDISRFGQLNFHL